ncbi:MAG: hypothetical protein U5R14_06155 [Gemmatimonadota bacterium]|nr:hypothetical protein [Gemmatimonadota bacterium]
MARGEGSRPLGTPKRGHATSVGALATLMGTALVLPMGATAQDVPTAEREAGLDDPRWTAFVGCWEPTAGDREDEAGLLCVRPAGEGVEMFTIQDGAVRTSDLLVGDGEPREIRAEGCEGWEAVSFSDDGRRAFTETAYTCDGIEQSGTGVLALVSPTEWVDVRALEVDGEQTSWVQRYRLVGVDRAAAEGVDAPGFGMETAARTARFVGHRGVGFVEVEEAAERVDAEAVEGWLASRREGFSPTAEDLEGLADAGVPESVIDVVVAKSFPERFSVDAEGAADRASRARDGARASGARRPVRYGPRVPFRMRGLGYGFGYVPVGPYFYGARSGYGYGYSDAWRYRPGTVIIERREPEPRGRIIRGRGYTRPSGDEGRSATPRSGSSGQDRPQAAPDRRSGGDADTDRDDPPRRRAEPRPPGGGG